MEGINLLEDLMGPFGRVS